MFKVKRSRKSQTVVLGKQRIRLRPLDPRQGVELCLLVGPYVPKLRRVLRIFKKDLEPHESYERLHLIAQTMGEAPGDFLEFVGLLIGRRADWVAENVTALEITDVLPRIVEFHDLWQLLLLGSMLGLFDLGE